MSRRLLNLFINKSNKRKLFNQFNYHTLIIRKRLTKILKNKNRRKSQNGLRNKKV